MKWPYLCSLHLCHDLKVGNHLTDCPKPIKCFFLTKLKWEITQPPYTMVIQSMQFACNALNHSDMGATRHYINHVRPLQFNYLSYKHFLEKKSCQTPKKKKKKSPLVSYGWKWIWNFLSDSKKKVQVKNILCKGWFNQLQEAIIAVVEPQTWGGIPTNLQVTGINWLIDFI